MRYFRLPEISETSTMNFVWKFQGTTSMWILSVDPCLEGKVKFLGKINIFQYKNRISIANILTFG